MISSVLNSQIVTTAVEDHTQSDGGGLLAVTEDNRAYVWDASSSQLLQWGGSFGRAFPWRYCHFGIGCLGAPLGIVPVHSCPSFRSGVYWASIGHKLFAMDTRLPGGTIVGNCGHFSFNFGLECNHGACDGNSPSLGMDIKCLSTSSSTIWNSAAIDAPITRLDNNIIVHTRDKILLIDPRFPSKLIAQKFMPHELPIGDKSGREYGCSVSYSHVIPKNLFGFVTSGEFQRASRVNKCTAKSNTHDANILVTAGPNSKQVLNIFSNSHSFSAISSPDKHLSFFAVDQVYLHSLAFKDCGRQFDPHTDGIYDAGIQLGAKEVV
jgi:hypothetical protein